jgi:asparagine synthase (glutamine-hydrolysing)
MVSSDGRYVIVFNGEIYNHHELRQILVSKGVQFRGHSDTEVLLAAFKEWDAGCLSRLRGMFAFAIYDSLAESVFLARDRAGEKPLFWAPWNSGLLFASELKALCADPRFHPKLSAQGLAFYLSFGYVPGDYCILDGVQKLKPAHYMRWSVRSGTAEVARYWGVPDPAPKSAEELEHLVDELEGLLGSAVKEQLEADVPVAVLLSGGLDSSIVTALAARVSGAPIRTFTVSIPGHTRYDEGRFGRQISEHFRTDHLELPIDSSSLDIVPKLAYQFDEPIADSSMIPTYLLAKTVSQVCKVVLGGDGGDELFGGYRMYQGALQQDRIRRGLPRFLRNAISVGAERLLPIGTAKRNGLIGLRGDLSDGVSQIGVMFGERDWAALSPWLGGRRADVLPRLWRRALVEPKRALPGAAMVADFGSYLPDDILTKVDRASMLCSLEVRAPMLDCRVIEFAYRSVPNELRATRAERKILLKHLGRRLLPRNFDIDRKQGFSIPVSSWLTPAVIRRWWDECREEIRSLFDLQADAVPRNEGAYHRLFQLMMITYWTKHYGVAL